MNNHLTKQARLFFWDMVIHLLSECEMVRRLLPRLIIFFQKRENINYILSVTAAAASGFTIGLILRILSLD